MSIDFRVRDFRYPISILQLRELFERSQWWSLDELVGYQEQRLRQVVSHAYQHVPYYQDLFRARKLTPADIRTVSDLEKLSQLSKATVRREFSRLQARNSRRYRPRVHHTTGTTGEPVHFLLDTPANVLEFAHYWRHWSWAGYRLGSRFAEFSSDYFLRRDRLADQPWRYQRGLGRLVLNSIALTPASVDECLSALRKYRPRFLKGLASVLYVFALFIDQRRAADLTFSGIFSTGEVLLPMQRTLIEKVFRTKVYDSYGQMERTVAITECPSGALHINPEYGVAELVDRSSASVGTTAGSERTDVVTARILGTSLHNFSMPLLRYEIGDLIETRTALQPCACGRAMPCVQRIIGRQEDVITTPDGRVVPSLFLVFNHVAGIALGQAVQHAPDHLVVTVARSALYTRQSEADLHCHVRRFVGPAVRIEVRYASLDELRPRTKAKFRSVISHVPHGGGIPSRASHGELTGA